MFSILSFMLNVFWIVPYIVDFTASKPIGVSCSYDEFRCKTGKCIPLDYQCDGMVDCGVFDQSDENNCGKVKDPCDFQPWKYFRCSITRRCISRDLVCDGTPDCLYGDWTDENNC